MSSLHFKRIKPNVKFMGRQHEVTQLQNIAAAKEAAIIIVHGRRRIGKTELIEQTYRKRNILKFEGLENQNETAQKRHVLYELSRYTNNPHLAHLTSLSWVEIIELIAQNIDQQTCTLYFEEVQWLANYRSDFIAALKYVWDNTLRHNRNLLIVLCGSSPAFMIQKVIQSKALYNRAQYEIPLQSFTLKETSELIGNKPQRAIMDAYLTIGGIPEYLKRIKKYSSLFLGICTESFQRGAFFATEHERIFISSLAHNPNYQKIIAYLSHKKFATREEIAKHLKTTLGGGLSDLLHDLASCGFLQEYTPYQLGAKSRLKRYCIGDAYLQFFFKFIEPHLDTIAQGRFNANPVEPVQHHAYSQWLGYSFERYCRAQHHLIATKLGFGGIRYHSGAFFNRETIKEKAGYQIDLLFERADHTITLCEIKYLNKPADKRVIQEFETKIDRFPLPSKHSIQKVLISAEGADQNLINTGYFDAILTLDDFF